MYQVRCGRCTGMVLLNRDYVGSEPGILAKRKALFAVGALRDWAHPAYSPAIVVLTEPEGKGNKIRISVHLTNGDQLFVGEAGVQGDVATWALKAVRRLGAFPIRAEGEFRGGKLEVKMAASARRVVLQARPRLMVR